MVFFVHYRYTSDMVFSHHVECILDSRATAYGHGIIDHTILRTFHNGYMTCLVLDGHVFVYYSDTAFSCYGNSHLRLGHCVHGSSDEWHVQFNITRELCFQLYRFWQYLRVSRNKQDVIESQAVHYDFVCNK